MNRIVFLFLSLVIALIAGCSTSSSHRRNFDSVNLILPIDAFSDNWEMVHAPKPMGDSIGFGDEDDSYVSYKLLDDKYNLAKHLVMHFSSEREASKEYERLLRTRFNDNSIATDKPWTKPSEFTFNSSTASQFHVACTINNVAGQKQVCQMMGQYEEFVTIFHSIIRLDTMSLLEFNEIVHKIDDIMVTNLNNNEDS